jgi:hypothetical protein
MFQPDNQDVSGNALRAAAMVNHHKRLKFQEAGHSPAISGKNAQTSSLKLSLLKISPLTNLQNHPTTQHHMHVWFLTHKFILAIVLPRKNKILSH